MNRVTIYTITWNNEQFIELLAKRIRETTNYPYRLVVAENRSEASPDIQKKLISLKEQGLVDKIYIFDENYVGTAMRFTIEHDEINRLKEDRSFYVRTDHDAYIKSLDESSTDWLEDYARVFDDRECSVRAIRMTSNTCHLGAYLNTDIRCKSFEYRDINGWIEESRRLNRIHKKYKYLSSNITLTNNHFQAVSESAMKWWFTTHPKKNPVDGVTQPWLYKEHNLHIYTPMYVENLSVYHRFPDPEGRVPIDLNYVSARENVFTGKTNEQGYGFHNYRPNNIKFKII